MYDGIDSADSSSSDARAPTHADGAAASGTGDAGDVSSGFLLFKKERSGAYRVRQCWFLCLIVFSFTWVCRLWVSARHMRHWSTLLLIFISLVDRRSRCRACRICFSFPPRVPLLPLLTDQQWKSY